MKLGANYWMFESGPQAPRPIAEAMQQAKDIGFDSVELCIASRCDGGR